MTLKVPFQPKLFYDLTGVKDPDEDSEICLTEHHYVYSLLTPFSY